jgi:hypothetical protein
MVEAGCVWIRVAELWDVAGPVPEDSPNQNGTF